jgi:hypothetical protein
MKSRVWEKFQALFLCLKKSYPTLYPTFKMIFRLNQTDDGAGATGKRYFLSLPDFCKNPRARI